MTREYLKEPQLAFLKKFLLRKYYNEDNSITFNYDDVIPGLDSDPNEACLLLAELEAELKVKISVNLDLEKAYDENNQLVNIYLSQEKKDSLSKSFLEEDFYGDHFIGYKSISEAKNYYYLLNDRYRSFILKHEEFCNLAEKDHNLECYDEPHFWDCEFKANVQFSVAKEYNLRDRIKRYYLDNKDVEEIEEKKNA